MIRNESVNKTPANGPVVLFAMVELKQREEEIDACTVKLSFIFSRTSGATLERITFLSGSNSASNSRSAVGS